MRIYATKEESRRARNASKARYDEANARHIGLKLNRKTDADILARIEKEESVQRYIKRLIREDIAKNG